MVEEKPVAAFTLSLIGLALQAVGAMFFAYAMLYGWGSGFWGSGMMMGPWMMMGGPWFGGALWSPLSSIFAVAVIAFGVLGLFWMTASELSRVRTGSTLVLVVSVIAFPTMFGFMIGSLLMFVGGILGLTWQPMTARVVRVS
ncbi:MAG: hypothetical protein HYY68_09985 [Thaumarchaeota archaeon]|nr:hypothetical protein [Nitrososphaerota archaeon]